MVFAHRHDHGLSLAEWDALDLDPDQRYELVRGKVQVVPRPTFFHQYTGGTLFAQLSAQLPAHLVALPEVEITVDPGAPATVRVPDLVVVHRELLQTDRGRALATDVLLAVEILSPGTQRTDTVTKHTEYADAGIPTYWIIDLDPPVTLTAHALVDGDYEITAKNTGRVTLLTPTDLTIDLDALLP